jgi:RNA polymerase sigma-70 factor (ECF subfamily)
MQLSATLRTVSCGDLSVFGNARFFSDLRGMSVVFWTGLRGQWKENSSLDSQEPNTDQLLALAADGDESARGRLLDQHRQRLRSMVAIRMDPRLTARVDPSDLVQDTLTEAHRRLDEYLCDRPLPFYPWLRQLAFDRLIDLHRRHVRSSRRAVSREVPGEMQLSDGSVHELARRLHGSASSPSARLGRKESRARLRAALSELPDIDREVLVLRHLEELPSAEVAAVLGISGRAESMRHLRALERLRKLLDDPAGED